MSAVMFGSAQATPAVPAISSGRFFVKPGSDPEKLSVYGFYSQVTQQVTGKNVTQCDVVDIGTNGTEKKDDARADEQKKTGLVGFFDRLSTAVSLYVQTKVQKLVAPILEKIRGIRSTVGGAIENGRRQVQTEVAGLGTHVDGEVAAFKAELDGDGIQTAILDGVKSDKDRQAGGGK